MTSNDKKAIQHIRVAMNCRNSCLENLRRNLAQRHEDKLARKFARQWIKDAREWERSCLWWGKMAAISTTEW